MRDMILFRSEVAYFDFCQLILTFLSVFVVVVVGLLD